MSKVMLRDRLTETEENETARCIAGHATERAPLAPEDNPAPARDSAMGTLSHAATA